MAANDKEPKEPTKSTTDSYTQEVMRELAQAEADRKAVMEEFAEEIKKRGELFDETDIKAKLKEVLPEAFAALKSLLNSAESETVRATMVKYIFDAALLTFKNTKKDGEEVPETVADLVKQLSDNDKSS